MMISNHPHLNGTALEQQLDHRLLRCALWLSDEAHPIGQGVAQGGVAHTCHQRLNVLHTAVRGPIRKAGTYFEAYDQNEASGSMSAAGLSSEAHAHNSHSSGVQQAAKWLGTLQGTDSPEHTVPL